MREKASTAESVRLILDLEVIMFWNKSKIDRSHLLYAEVKDEKDKEDDLSVGIGTKVTKIGNNLKK